MSVGYSIPICAKTGLFVILGRRSHTHPSKNGPFCPPGYASPAKHLQPSKAPPAQQGTSSPAKHRRRNIRPPAATDRALRGAPGKGPPHARLLPVLSYFCPACKNGDQIILLFVHMTDFFEVPFSDTLFFGKTPRLPCFWRIICRICKNFSSLQRKRPVQHSIKFLLERMCWRDFFFL